MSYEIYKILHIAGLAGLLMAVFTVLAESLVTNGPIARHARSKAMSALHGISLVIMLVAGLGMMARLGIPHNPASWPVWIWIKVVIWLDLGVLLFLAKRNANLAKILWGTVPLLVIAASAVAILKIGQ